MITINEKLLWVVVAGKNEQCTQRLDASCTVNLDKFEVIHVLGDQNNSPIVSKEIKDNCKMDVTNQCYEIEAYESCFDILSKLGCNLCFSYAFAVCNLW